MFISDCIDPPEGHPEQLVYTFVIRILSKSLTSVYIFSVCCYSRYLSRWERLTAIVQGSDSNSGSTGWRNSTPPKTSTPRMRAVFIRMHCSRRIPAEGTVIGRIRIMLISLSHETFAIKKKENVENTKVVAQYIRQKNGSIPPTDSTQVSNYSYNSKNKRQRRKE